MTEVFAVLMDSVGQLYEMLTTEEQKMADHSWVEYWPYPYQAIENCKGNANGLGLENQGKEHTIEELGEYEESKIKKVSRHIPPTNP